LTVAFFIQCLTDRLYPEMAQSVVDVLAGCGARVTIPTGQHCCGLVADDAGDRPTAIALAKATIEALEHASAHWVVTGAASCAIAIRHDYPRLLHQEPGWVERAGRLAERTLDFTSFLAGVVDPPADALAGPPGPIVTIHRFCGSTNVLGLHHEPARILREVLGLEVREMRDSSVCCGFGGSFAIEHPRVARFVAERKIENARDTGSELIVTDNPGCIGHLRGVLHARGERTRVAHLAEVVAERLRGRR
jgi:Fe-S oxidoreductase